MSNVGDVNRNDQRLIAKTKQPGTDHMQYIWILECVPCGHRYGANGSDYFQRKCPACQDGKAGLDYSSEA